MSGEGQDEKMAIIRRIFILKPPYLEIRMNALAGNMNEGEFHR